MDYIELSKENVKEKCIIFNKIIKEEYNFDLIIFVEKGAFYIGKYLSEESRKPLLSISATRKGNGLKKFIKPILKIIPQKIQIYLRKKEMESNYHKKKSERIISFDKNIWKGFKDKKNILLVDDSIDTGNSIEQVYNAIKSYYKDSNVEVAVFNCMDKATFKPKFTLYKNTMINGPWSSDSKYNKHFMEDYYDWKNENEI